MIVVLSAGHDAALRFMDWIEGAGLQGTDRVVPELFTTGRGVLGVTLADPTRCIVLVSDEGGDPERRVLTHLRLTHPTAAIVTVSSDGAATDTAPGFDSADERLDHTVSQRAFLAAVQRALQLAQLRSELQYMRIKDASGAEIGQLVGESEPMREVLSQVMTLCRRTTRHRGPAVLITGETGTGKGQIARAIHYNGTRRDRPIVEVNCASLQESLVEAELFGAQKGAYTGADQSRDGLFEVAHNGTIFLDEIGTLSLDLQAKLLRVLDEAVIRRVGSTSERSLDVQVICATHRDLEAAVRMGQFRKDLYYRLSVIHMTLPPLRDRDHDVVLIARSFLKQLCAEYGGPALRLSPEAEEALLRYDWPGNVRELRNRMERVVLLCDREVVGPEHLELPVNSVSVEARESGIRVDIPPGGIDLAKVERAFIEEAMRQAEGNVSQAARLLKMSRSTLRYRLKS